MKFTDRFIRVPIEIYEIAEKELTGKASYYPTTLKFNPLEISNYHPTFDDKFPEKDCVQVHLKNGYQAIVYMTMPDFEALLNKSYQ